jgi:hypothetical protein
LKYDGQVVEALRVCWATLDGATGKRLAPALPERVASLRRHGELDVDDRTAVLLVGMSPATIDRRLVADRRQLERKGKAHTKPGSLLKSQIPMRTLRETARVGGLLQLTALTALLAAKHLMSAFVRKPKTRCHRPSSVAQSDERAHRPSNDGLTAARS